MIYLFLITIIVTTIFLLLFKRNYTSLLNGFLFIISAFLILSSISIAALRLDNQIINIIIIILALPIIFLMLFSAFITVMVLLLSAYKTFKNESKSLANSLALLLAVAIITYIMVGNLIITDKAPYIVVCIWTTLSFIITIYFLHAICFTTSAILAYKVKPKFEKNYIIVLGSGLINGNVTPLLAKRIDRAITFYNKQAKKTQPPTLLFSGGQGKDESRPEAIAMQEYAIKQGIPIEHTLVETKSTTTYENFLFSKEIITTNTKPVKAIFSTSNYHVFRAASFAKKVGLPMYGIGSKTIWYFYINAFIREYVANIWVHKKFHITFISLVVILSVIVSTLIYFILNNA